MFTSPIATRDSLSVRGNALPSGTPVLGQFLGVRSGSALQWAGPIMDGLASARPGTGGGTPGRMYFSTDSKVLEYDTNAAWQNLTPYARLKASGSLGSSQAINGTTFVDLVSLASATLNGPSQHVLLIANVHFQGNGGASQIDYTRFAFTDASNVVLAPSGTGLSEFRSIKSYGSGSAVSGCTLVGWYSMTTGASLALKLRVAEGGQTNSTTITAAQVGWIAWE